MLEPLPVDAFYKFIGDKIAAANMAQAYHSSRLLIYKNQHAKLYHYSCHPRPPKIPVLIVFATINDPSILDLDAHCSFIKNLQEQNLDIYLLEWNNPSKATPTLSWQDYINQLNKVLQVLAKKTQGSINVIGVCQGGVLTLHALILSAVVKKIIKNVVLITTPIDFHASDFILPQLARQIDSRVLKEFAIIPGLWLRNFFISLNPIELTARKFLRLFQNQQNANWLQRFLQIEKWFNTMPNQHSKALSQFMDIFFQANYFLQTNALKKINQPILSIIAEKDKLISQQATKALTDILQKKDFTEASFPAGHIGIYLNDNVRNKMAETIAHWLNTRVDNHNI